MQQNDRFTVINIREYLKNDGDADQLCEDELKQILAEFSCSKNYYGFQIQKMRTPPRQYG